MEFITGAAAAATAVCFTNPLEVIKIRMQLQGELAAEGQYSVRYKNFFHAGYVIAKYDGISALQSGLLTAVFFQIALNGLRLGLYQTITDHGWMQDSVGNLVFYKSVLVGGITGGIGGFVASPFYLIKTHQQSFASKEIAFGHQYENKGTWAAFLDIFQQHGIKGLFRGSSAGVPRLFVASTSQLTTFTYCRDIMKRHAILEGWPFLALFTASMIGGIAVGVMMTPFDLVATRLYNQGVDKDGKGLLYKSYFDCILKIWKSEGFLGFWKGLGPCYLRIGPHTVFCMVFWDKYKQLYKTLFPKDDPKK